MIWTGQTAVSGTVPVLSLPPSSCNAVLYTTSGTAYVGPGSTVTTLNGMALTNTLFTMATFARSSPAVLWGTTGGPSTVTVNWLISTNA